MQLKSELSYSWIEFANIGLKGEKVRNLFPDFI